MQPFQSAPPNLAAAKTEVPKPKEQLNMMEEQKQPQLLAQSAAATDQMVNQWEIPASFDQMEEIKGDDAAAPQDANIFSTYQ